MTPRFDLVAITTADMAASLAFYRRLGLDIPADADAAPHVEVALPGGLRMAWDSEETIRSFHPDWAPGNGGQRLTLAFACDSPAEVDALATELTSVGGRIEIAPWDAFWGQRYAVVADPDGQTVDLFAPLA